MSAENTSFEADLKLRLQELAVRVVEALDKSRTSDAASGILLTSARGGEGKTTIAIHLARSMAHISGQQVALVDANFQSPEISRIFQLDGSQGFSDLILANCVLETCKTAVQDGVTILGAGSTPDSVLLSRSAAYQTVLVQLSRKFRYVVFDGAIARLGGSMLAKQVDSVIVVVDSTETRREVVQGAIASMHLPAGKLLGCILNKRKRYIPNFLYRAL